MTKEIPIGFQSGFLEVIERDLKTHKKGEYYLCKCHCGKIASVRKDHLIKKETLSCGCWRDEKRSQGRGKNEYYIKDNIAHVKFTNKNEEFICDAEDWEKYKNHTWYANELNYAVTRIDKKLVKFHRLILNVTDSTIEVDHKDRNPQNNLKSNLRICIHQQNSCNLSLHSNNTTRITGVCYYPIPQKYHAYITFQQKQYFLGSFDTLEEAKEVRRKYEKEWFKEFSPYFEEENEKI